jgi:hypothetical protein
MATVLVVGCGVVGTRTARQLLSIAGVSHIVLSDPRTEHVEHVVASLGVMTSPIGARSWTEVAPDLVVIATPPGHRTAASKALSLGAHVVSVSDSIDDAVGLLGLHSQALSAGRQVVVGAGFSPGLTCLLAVHAATEFSRVDEIHVAKTGTAGPDCARQHHLALRTDSRDWRDGQWISKPGGSGRELCWFPSPIGGLDCYRGALSDPVLLHPAFSSAERITSRLSATRRDRLTSRLPMLRKPHAEAGEGAVRVEVRGLRQGIADSVILGAMNQASVGSAAVLAEVTGIVLAGETLRTGAGGMAEMIAAAPTLAKLAAKGIRCSRFEGASATTAPANPTV